MNRIIKKVPLFFSIVVISSSILMALEAGPQINSEFRISSGGAELYLKVRGQDANKPVVLFLHGGPGDPTGPLLFQAYAGPVLEQHFIVGYLHQRNTCMSPEAPVESLTIKQFVEDVDAVAAFLKKKYRRDKLFLLGHSFGGVLGYLYLLEHEDNVKKFVSAGGAFSARSIETNGYRTVMELARKAGNQDAVDKLKQIGPPPYDTFQEGMVWRMLGMNLLKAMNEGMDKNVEMSTVFSITGVESFQPEWQQKSMVTVNSMWNELNTLDIENQVRKIRVPLLQITGAKDIMVPALILENGFNNYGGPKEHFILEQSNHMMFADEPGLFAQRVIEFFKK